MVWNFKISGTTVRRTSPSGTENCAKVIAEGEVPEGCNFLVRSIEEFTNGYFLGLSFSFSKISGDVDSFIKRRNIPII